MDLNEALLLRVPCSPSLALCIPEGSEHIRVCGHEKPAAALTHFQLRRLPPDTVASPGLSAHRSPSRPPGPSPALRTERGFPNTPLEEASCSEAGGAVLNEEERVCPVKALPGLLRSMELA